VIEQIESREILDSRGNPTAQVDVRLERGALGRAAVPSGTSLAAREAVDLRDGARCRFGGKGVLKAVVNVHTILAPALVGTEALEQRSLDATMITLDGTPNNAK
jgi:enolase